MFPPRAEISHSRTDAAKIPAASETRVSPPRARLSLRRRPGIAGRSCLAERATHSGQNDPSKYSPPEIVARPWYTPSSMTSLMNRT